MDVEAATDEISSKALSCSPLIEISDHYEEIENYPSMWKLQNHKNRLYGTLKVQSVT